MVQTVSLVLGRMTSAHCEDCMTFVNFPPLPPPHFCVCVHVVYKLVILLNIHVAEILLPDLLLNNNHWIKDAFLKRSDKDSMSSFHSPCLQIK